MRTGSLLLRGVAAGALGTAAMGACEYLHVRLRTGARGPATGDTATDVADGRDQPIDYDVSAHVPLATARVLRLPLRRDEDAAALFLLTQAGYGSAFGVVAALLGDAGLTPGRQAAVFFALTETMALALFPTLGATPPPWRWRAEPLVTSVLQHALYSGSVVLTARALARRSG